MQCGLRHVFALRLAPLLLLSLQVNARSALSVKDELRAGDLAGVGGGNGADLIALSSDLLGLPELDLSNIEEQQPTTTATFLQRRLRLSSVEPPESTQEEESESGAELLEDGGRSVEGGDMAKVKTALSAAESKNAKLKQQNAEAESVGSSLQKQIEVLQKQVEAANASQNEMQHAQNANSLEQMQNEVEKEMQQTAAMEHQASRLRQESELRKQAGADASDEVAIQSSEVEALKVKINLAAEERQDLQKRLRHLKVNATVGSKTSLLAQQQMDTTSRQQAETNQKLRELMDSKNAEDEQVSLLEARKSFLQHRQTLLVRPEKLLRDENQLLKTQLSKELEKEKKIQQMFSNKRFYLQMQADRDAETQADKELAKTQAATENLNQEAKRYGEMVFTLEMARHAAELKIQGMQVATADKVAENRQVKERTLPLLEYRVNQELQSARRTAQLLQEVTSERDAVRAELSGAQQDIVQAQDRYAQVLQAVVAQTGGSDRQSPRRNMLLERQYAQVQQQQANQYPARRQEAYVGAFQTDLAAQLQNSPQRQERAFQPNSFAEIEARNLLQQPQVYVSHAATQQQPQQLEASDYSKVAYNPFVSSDGMEALEQVMPEAPVASLLVSKVDWD